MITIYRSLSDATLYPPSNRTNVKPQQSLAPPATDERLLSLDTYRGMIMVALAFNGFGLADTAKRHLATQPDSTFWKQLQFQFYARGVARLCFLGHDPAIVHVHGRRVDGVLLCQTPGAR